MSSESELWSKGPNFPDPVATREALAEIFVNAANATRAAAHKVMAPPEAAPFDIADKTQALWKFGFGLMTDPVALADAQLKALNEWGELWSATLKTMSGETAEPVIEPAKGDRRFADPAWSAEPLFNHLKQSYLLASRQLTQLVDGAGGVDDETRARVGFLMKQYLDAVAPSNFATTNPEVIRKTLESGGQNLLVGLANMLADAASGKGVVERRTKETFELGVTIAATPGSVIFQSDLFQLIQYDPVTPQVSRRPMLYVPPLVNKYYMMDLQPKASLLKWLTEQGRTVFTISWINPGPEQRDKDFAAYVLEGVLKAMDVVKKTTGEPDTDLFGFCMGGAIAATALAYLTAKGEADRVGSLTLIGSLLDFSDMREWSIFSTESDLAAFDKSISPKGYVESHDLQKLFSLMRANDLIWSSVVNHYLLDKEAPPSDILYWFADGARIPAAFLKSYGDIFVRGNKLKDAGAVSIGGVALDLGKITTPVFMVSLKDDHVSAWEATYSGAKLFGGPTQFILGGSGHNAGVINPPAANKHGYWTNADLPPDAEVWMDTAVKQPGSWWPTWQDWLSGLDGDQKPARKVGKAIEPAPGSYVRMR